MNYVIIKAYKPRERWDFKNNKPKDDLEPIGMVKIDEESIPEGWIAWTPNKIFDRRKYPELYNLFGKDHMLSEKEMELYIQKNWNLWYLSQENSLTRIIFYIILLIIGIITILFIK